MYAMVCTRPGISHAVGTVSRYMHDQVQSLFRLDQHCKSLIASLSVFGGVAAC